jgi:hypothetical protein
MPLRQYFVWVGSVLLVALFVADWRLPAPVSHPHSEIAPNQRTNLRIRSDQKWPERVVFDTAHSGLSLAAEARPEPYVVPPQGLVPVEQHGSLDAFAAMKSTQAAPTATSDQASAIQAKPGPASSRVARMAKAD